MLLGKEPVVRVDIYSHECKLMTMTEPTILDTIRGWKWFAYAPPDAQQWLADRASLKKISKGAIVFSVGDPVKCLYGVISGNFRIYVTTQNGDQITLEDVAAGSWFAHWSPYQDPVYRVSCDCQRDSVVAAIGYEDVGEFSRRWPEFYRGLYEEVADRHEVIVARIELLSFHTLDVRLAVYFLRMLHLRAEKKTQGTTFVDMGISQTEVAARVGGARQRVSSIINKWKKRGLIEVNDAGDISVRDIESMKAEAMKTGFDLSTYLAAWHGGWREKK